MPLPNRLVYAIKNGIDKDWNDLLFTKAAGVDLLFELVTRAHKHNTNPDLRDILAPFRECPRRLLRAIIIGYTPLYDSTGLSYSTGGLVDTPELRDLYARLDYMTAPPIDYTLIQWARQGVLMINLIPVISRQDPDTEWIEWTRNILSKLLDIPMYSISSNVMREIPNCKPLTGKAISNTLVYPDPNFRYTIFIDGSFKTKSKQCAWAIYDGVTHHTASGTVTRGTPSAPLAEYNGMLQALKYLQRIWQELPTTHIVLCTDHKNLERMLNDWIYKWIAYNPDIKTKADGKPIAHAELVRAMHDSRNKLIALGLHVEIIHFNSHTREPTNRYLPEWKLWYGNKQVDAAAQRAAE